MSESEGKAKTFMDNSSIYNHTVRKDQVIREYQVALEEFDMVRSELAHCVRTHGVNNFVICRDLRTKYLKLQEDRLVMQFESIALLCAYHSRIN